jgi:hypothetical protein
MVEKPLASACACVDVFDTCERWDGSTGWPISIARAVRHVPVPEYTYESRTSSPHRQPDCPGLRIVILPSDPLQDIRNANLFRVDLSLSYCMTAFPEGSDPAKSLVSTLTANFPTGLFKDPKITHFGRAGQVYDGGSLPYQAARGSPAARKINEPRPKRLSAQISAMMGGQSLCEWPIFGLRWR